MISSVNYAETLVRPSKDPATLRTVISAISALRIRTHAPDAAVARSAGRLRSAGGISLADCFAISTALALEARIATFDHRVQRAAEREGLQLAGIFFAAFAKP